MKTVLVLFIFMFQLVSFSNICSKVGIGDLRSEFEKIYGKAGFGPLTRGEKTENIIFYDEETVTGSFYNGIVYRHGLNKKDKVLKIDEVEKLIVDHIPKDSTMISDWEWGISDKPFVSRLYYSKKIESIFDFAKKNEKGGNFYVSVERDFKNTIYASIQISVIEPKLSKEDLAKRKAKIEAERKEEEKKEKALKAKIMKQLEEEGKNAPLLKKTTPEEQAFIEQMDAEIAEGAKNAREKANNK